MTNPDVDSECFNCGRKFSQNVTHAGWRNGWCGPCIRIAWSDWLDAGADINRPPFPVTDPALVRRFNDYMTGPIEVLRQRFRSLDPDADRRNRNTLT